MWHNKGQPYPHRQMALGSEVFQNSLTGRGGGSGQQGQSEWRAREGSQAIRFDYELNIRVGPYEYGVRVLGLSGQRGPAPEAALLYAESIQSKAAPEALAARLSAERIYGFHEKGRPT